MCIYTSLRQRHLPMDGYPKPQSLIIACNYQMSRFDQIWELRDYYKHLISINSSDSLPMFYHRCSMKTKILSMMCARKERQDIGVPIWGAMSCPQMVFGRYPYISPPSSVEGLQPQGKWTATKLERGETTCRTKVRFSSNVWVTSNFCHGEFQSMATPKAK